MESWGAKRKRTKRASTRFPYNKLPKELQIEIMRKLPAKDLSKAMCVSKPWRDLILLTCLPFIPVSLRFLGLFLRFETDTKRETPAGWTTLFTEPITRHPYVGLDQIIKWCSRVMQCRVTARKLIDTCNGLLLFGHNDGMSELLSPDLYYYYVINPITKQCMAVLKPRPTTPRFIYAALAYDPAESWFFRIVRFQGCRHLHVFSSETGCWTTLGFKLPQEVANAKWEKKSVYYKGAIYRLSSSGHVIKFLVDPQENVEKQAVAIALPCNCYFYNCHRLIGIRNRRLIFAVSAGSCLVTWDLVEHCNGGECTYSWSETHKVADWVLWQLNSHGQLLCIHPYFGIALFKYRQYIFYYFYCGNTLDFRTIGFGGFYYHCTNTSGFPFLECALPFACRLDKMYPGLFERIPIPEACRGMGVSLAN